LDNATAGRILGVVHPLGVSTPIDGLNNLTYNGGPVMHTNKVYAIYWFPAGSTYSANYRSLIDRYFADVSADNGKTSNVYYSDTQYGDGSGKISYSSSFGGSVVDTNAFPADGCADTSSLTTRCLSDAQLQTEIQRVKTANGWASNPSTMFFMFTPKGVGSCAGTECAYTVYCAYHSWYGSGSSVTLYANMPYADTDPSSCDAGDHPNGDDADATLNVTSHEHNEAITDEQGDAWYDLTGNENGDKCAWDFGTALGGATGARWNQVINGDHYWLQQEWSNASSGCVLTGT
jgi:hypothetical protein